MEPSRLRENARSGLERDLLRSALTDAAPAAVRAHVLDTVQRTLEERALEEAPSPSSDAALSVAPAPPRRAWRARALGSSLAAALAAAAGAAVLLHSHALSRPADVTAAQGFEAAREVVPAAASEPAPLQSLPAPTTHAATLAASSLRVSEPARSSRPPPPVEEDTEGDWLGAQLELLGTARAQIASGRLDEAGKLLGEYEQRFPGGVVRPQVERLRAELRERRAALLDDRGRAVQTERR